MTIDGFGLLDLVLRLGTVGAALWAVAWSIATRRASVRKEELAEVRLEGEKLEHELRKEVEELERKHHEERDKGQDSRSELRERLIQIEQKLTTMPDGEAVHRLELGVSYMGSDVKVLSETVKTLAQMTRRVDEYLFNTSQRQSG